MPPVRTPQASPPPAAPELTAGSILEAEHDSEGRLLRVRLSAGADPLELAEAIGAILTRQKRQQRDPMEQALDDLDRAQRTSPPWIGA